MAKYDPIYDYLVSLDCRTVTLSYIQLEDIIGAELPLSAYKHDQWWKRGEHVQDNAWLDAGWVVKKVVLGEYVMLSKEESRTMSEMEEKSFRDNLWVVSAITKKMCENKGAVDIPLLRGGSFQAVLSDNGIEVSNLGEQPFLPWAVFVETVVFLKKNRGKALRGDAVKYRLGEDGLPLNSVEGHIAHTTYGKQMGDSVFRRITPIACLLMWAGICEHTPGYLLLKEI